MSCREGSKETGGDRQRNIGGRARFTRFVLALGNSQQAPPD